MEKVINYVRQGKGLGLLFILAASVLVTIIFVLLGKELYSETREQVLTVAGDFLPITVQKGVITEPEDTYKRVNVDFGKMGDPKDMIAIVLNTREDFVVSPQDMNGLYLLKNQIYVVSSTQMRHYALQDGIWNMERFEKLMDDVAGVIFVSISVILIGMLFLICLVKTFTAALLGKLLLKVVGKSADWDMPALMRLCAVLVALWEILRWGCVFLGIELTGFSAFVIVLILELVFLFKENPAEN